MNNTLCGFGFFEVLEMGPRALSMSGKHLTTELQAQLLKCTFYQKLRSYFSLEMGRLLMNINLSWHVKLH